MTRVELLYFEDCPNWQMTDEHLRNLAAEVGFEIEHRLIETPAGAEAVGFHGSPSILIDGKDPFEQGDEPVGLSCRIYQTPNGPAGSPTLGQLRAALADAT